ncbi:hypothetical protein vBAbaMD22_51 [Acinetobacter phage vB_AbaM_D22]|nr:hypothetical protein vBAbaMD22_51 [Acinetobacter phage vB_AbaM_D22]
MRNTSIVKRGEFKQGLVLPTGVNDREKQMFIAFAKSVNQGLFKI